MDVQRTAEGQVLTLTPRQYAELKGWCLQTVYNHLWQGKLPEAKKFLDRWVIVLPQSDASKRADA